MRNLRLHRPLVFFDLETTGIDVVKDRIVQIGLVRIEPDGSRRTYEFLVNPQRPIPAQATAVHGITDADVAGEPTFRQIAPEIAPLFADADIAGYNSVRYDLPLLVEEFQRAGQTFETAGRRHLDAMTIFHKKEPRHLAAALRFYCGTELQDAHTALADASATMEILDAQLERYEDLPRDLDDLHSFCNPDEDDWVDRTRKFAWNEGGEVVFAFGKHRGKSLQEIARSTPGYLDWIADSEFPTEVKQIARDALVGKFPTKK